MNSQINTEQTPRRGLITDADSIDSDPINSNLNDAELAETDSTEPNLMDVGHADSDAIDADSGDADSINAGLLVDDNERPQSTWEMTPANVVEDARALRDEFDVNLNLNEILPQSVRNSDDPEPSEDGSVESEMTEELFRDRN